MICPACGVDNLNGADRCDNCMSPLAKLDIPQPQSGFQKRLMEDPVSVLKPVIALSVSPDSSVGKAIGVMRDSRVGCVAVIDGNRLIGILSERDVVNKIGLDKKLLNRSSVREVMTPTPVTLTPEESIRVAVHHMSVGGFRHIPIVEDNQPVRMISIRDVLEFLCDTVLEGESGVLTVGNSTN
ncbi:MAG: CBS domain-containing protein [Acidobacteriota bacterium]